MNRHTATGSGLAILAFTAAVILFGRALAGALVIEPVPPAAGDPADGAAADETDAARRPLSSEALALAVDADPFQPDRRRHPDRYRLPGDVEPPAPALPPPPPPPPPFRLIGTGIAADGGVAVIEIENTARVLSVGETYLGYTLTAVEPDNALMTGAEQAVRLPLVASAGGEQAGGRGNTGRGGAAGRASVPTRTPPPPPGRGAAGPQELRELVEAIRSRGGNITPQMLEMIQRMQAEGREVRIDPGTGGAMIIRTTRPDTSDIQAPRRPDR